MNIDNFTVVSEFLKLYYAVYEKRSHMAPMLYSENAIIAHETVIAQGKAAIACVVTSLPMAGTRARVVSMNFQVTDNGLMILVQGIAAEHRPFSQTFVLGKVSQSHRGHFECTNDMMLYAPVRRPVYAMPPVQSVAGHISHSHAHAHPMHHFVGKPTWPEPPRRSEQEKAEAESEEKADDCGTESKSGDVKSNPETASTAVSCNLSTEEYAMGDCGNAAPEACKDIPVTADPVSKADELVHNEPVEAQITEGVCSKLLPDGKESVRSKSPNAVRPDTQDASIASPLSCQDEGPLEQLILDWNICNHPRRSAAAPATENSPKNCGGSRGKARSTSVWNHGKGRRSYGPTAVLHLHNLEFDPRRIGKLKKDLHEEFSSYGHAVRSVAVKTRMGLAFIEYDSALAVRTAVNVWRRGVSEGKFSAVNLKVNEKRRGRRQGYWDRKKSGEDVDEKGA